MNVTRLKRRAQFQELTNKGRKQVCPAFVLLCQKTNTGVVEVGFTASKKIGNAVKRNKAKRRLKALVDKVMRLNDKFGCNGMEIVLIARYKVLDRSFDQMEEELKTALTALECKV